MVNPLSLPTWLTVYIVAVSVIMLCILILALCKAASREAPSKEDDRHG